MCLVPPYPLAALAGVATIAANVKVLQPPAGVGRVARHVELVAGYVHRAELPQVVPARYITCACGGQQFGSLGWMCTCRDGMGADYQAAHYKVDIDATGIPHDRMSTKTVVDIREWQP